LVPLIVRFPERVDVQATMPSRGWISLTKVFKLVRDVLEGVASDGRLLLERYYDRIVFSETFGIPHDLRIYFTSEEWRKVQDVFDRYKIAVYRDNCKFIVDFEAGKVEYVQSYTGGGCEAEVEEVVGVIMRRYKVAEAARRRFPVRGVG
jgi:hypothetical protein